MAYFPINKFIKRVTGEELRTKNNQFKEMEARKQQIEMELSSLQEVSGQEDEIANLSSEKENLIDKQQEVALNEGEKEDLFIYEVQEAANNSSNPIGEYDKLIFHVEDIAYLLENVKKMAERDEKDINQYGITIRTMQLKKNGVEQLFPYLCIVLRDADIANHIYATTMEPGSKSPNYVVLNEEGIEIAIALSCPGEDDFSGKGTRVDYRTFNL
ncbi:MAG: hypothetical protein AAF960_07395 [Bacteroidota bacterium]